MRKRPPSKAKGKPQTETYRHQDKELLLRPDVGLQAQFRAKKPPATYRYDPSLDPQLFWAGKAERTSFEVPTLPLFVHERLATMAILETLKGHREDKTLTLFDLFGDSQLSITDRILKAYEHKDRWVNRIILGDSLVVMNSLLHYEGLGGQVQMIYMDPPYGVNFGSNFQPFVRQREVKHNDDGSLTREPEMVQAYRDTWELGVHSYLTYLRDRLLLARDLLAPTGSIFVQIGDENLHHLREVMDEVFRMENFIGVIPFRKKTMPLGAKYLERMNDFLVWYARDAERMKYTQLYSKQSVEGDFHWSWYELPDGTRHKMTKEQLHSHALLPKNAKVFRLVSMWPPTFSPKSVFPLRFRGQNWKPPEGQCWPSGPEAMQRLVDGKRIEIEGEYLRYVLYLDDYKLKKLTANWEDTTGARDQLYVVQTSEEVVKRCLLMTTTPGDLVLDPTCGSGTTAYVAEQWGRRWITIDASRVPLALARQRLLTATFPWYELVDEARGPAGGFIYKPEGESRNPKYIGPGIVPHVTLKSIANNEPAEQEILVDRPEVYTKTTRVSGPFTVEATIPTPVDFDANGTEDSGTRSEEDDARFVDRMLEALRRSPVLHLPSAKAVNFKNVRPPAKTLSLSAEALVTNGKDDQLVAFVFGPENGSVSEKLVFNAAKEANGKNYTHLYVIGFAIEPDARQAIEECTKAFGVPATYVQATPDLIMSDLLKSTRASQVFSVCGLPEVRLIKLKKRKTAVRSTAWSCSAWTSSSL